MRGNFVLLFYSKFEDPVKKVKRIDKAIESLVY